LEDRLVYLRETRDNVYTPFPYVAANTIVAIPFIFLVALSFSSVAYVWFYSFLSSTQYMIGLTDTAEAFFIFTGYLFLALLVAESIVVLVSAIIPIFVAALAIVAFLNGWFMVVQGYFVQFQNIPIGWQWANLIDYQKYAVYILSPLTT
jgi:ABC-type multidrug transport system permease subunit